MFCFLLALRFCRCYVFVGAVLLLVLCFCWCGRSLAAVLLLVLYFCWCCVSVGVVFLWVLTSFWCSFCSCFVLFWCRAVCRHRWGGVPRRLERHPERLPLRKEPRRGQRPVRPVGFFRGGAGDARSPVSHEHQVTVMICYWVQHMTPIKKQSSKKDRPIFYKSIK